jgi:hypothetical protein
MRVLFSAETPLSLTTFQSVLRLLGERGHEVTVAVHEEREAVWRRALLDSIVGEAPNIVVEPAIDPDPDRWLELAADIRSALDLVQFLSPRFNDTYRERAWRRAPRPAAWLARTRAGRASLVRKATAASFRVADRVIPTNDEIERYLVSRRPDVVLFTPYVGLRTIQPDFLRAAQALGLRTGVCVKSWDNLSSKSLIRPVPDRVFVWNGIQREEALTLHSIPPSRIVVTGAQCFDEWFAWSPRPREEFCGRVGLDPARPLVLYACSVPWTGQSEVGFVRRWVSAIRAAGGLFADAGVLVRPHPKRAHDWADDDLSDLPGVVVYPSDGHAPTDDASKADYYDSIYHSSAVVGLNTSAMIEAAIVGRPVLTVLEPEFERVQGGTLHFRYLLEVGGGLLRSARTLDEHVDQLKAAVAGVDDAASRASQFIAEFVRPHGLNVPATPIFVDEVERLAEAAAPRPRRTPPSLLPLRPLLAPLASRAGRYAAIAKS